MALIKCPECGKDGVSDSANACPNCGFNINQYISRSATVNNETNIQTGDNGSYAFHCFISLIIPLIGFIIGAVLLTDNSAKRRSIGKTCIGLSFFSAITITCLYIAFVYAM